MNIFSTLIVVMVSWVCAYVQTHQTVYINYVQFIEYQLCFNKAIKYFKVKLVILHFQ